MSDDTDNVVSLPAPEFRLRPLDPEISAEWDTWKDLEARWHKNQYERRATGADDDDGTLVYEEVALVREMAMTPATRWQHILFKVRVFREVTTECDAGHEDKLLLASVEADLEHRYD